jgi:hypothetical protein
VAIKLTKEMKALGRTRGVYFIIRVQHQLSGDQSSMCTNQGKVNMHLYKVCTDRHFFDPGFLGWCAQNRASIVPCPTNSR